MRARNVVERCFHRLAQGAAWPPSDDPESYQAVLAVASILLGT